MGSILTNMLSSDSNFKKETHSIASLLETEKPINYKDGQQEASII